METVIVLFADFTPAVFVSFGVPAEVQHIYDVLFEDLWEGGTHASAPRKRSRAIRVRDPDSLIPASDVGVAFCCREGGGARCRGGGEDYGGVLG